MTKKTALMENGNSTTLEKKEGILKNDTNKYKTVGRISLSMQNLFSLKKSTSTSKYDESILIQSPKTRYLK